MSWTHDTYSLIMIRMIWWCPDPKHILSIAEEHKEWEFVYSRSVPRSVGRLLSPRPSPFMFLLLLLYPTRLGMHSFHSESLVKNADIFFKVTEKWVNAARIPIEEESPLNRTGRQSGRQGNCGSGILKGSQFNALREIRLRRSKHVRMMSHSIFSWSLPLFPTVMEALRFEFWVFNPDRKLGIMSLHFYCCKRKKNAINQCWIHKSVNNMPCWGGDENSFGVGKDQNTKWISKWMIK